MNLEPLSGLTDQRHYQAAVMTHWHDIMSERPEVVGGLYDGLDDFWP